MNIYEKMSAATERINRVAKNLKVGVGQSTYKAVGESDVLEAVKPVEIELGIYSYPHSRKVIDTNVFVTTSEYNGKVTEKTSLFLRVETVYRFVNTEKPDEFIDVVTYGDGVDPQDKAPGKAMTYSDKYALLKAYKIETGDDPDQKASQDMRPHRQRDEFQLKINKVQLDALNMLIEKTSTDPSKVCAAMKVDKLESLTVEQWIDVTKKLEAKQK